MSCKVCAYTARLVAGPKMATKSREKVEIAHDLVQIASCNNISIGNDNSHLSSLHVIDILPSVKSQSIEKIITCLLVLPWVIRELREHTKEPVFVSTYSVFLLRKVSKTEAHGQRR